MTRLVLALIPAALVAGCGSGLEPTGEAVPAPGVYTGTVVDLQGLAGRGTARLDLTVRASGELGGRWLFDFSNGAYRRGGTIGGAAAGGSVEMRLTPDDPLDCPFTVRAMTREGSRITGTFVATPCTVIYAGSIDLQQLAAALGPAAPTS